MAEVRADVESGTTTERQTLLQRRGTSTSTEARHYARSKSQGIMPLPGSAMLSSRLDIGEMIYMQEGDGLPDGYQPEGELGAESADEEKPQKREIKKIFGVDQRPFFPAALMFSILWSMSLTSAQNAVVNELLGPTWHFNTLFVTVYSVTCVAMAYTALANPGYMDDNMYRQYLNDQRTCPERANKHWLYKRPVLRFHQYCRWVTNCIGLYNHREYIVMLIGFVCMATLDSCLDLIHIVWRLFQFDRYGHIHMWVTWVILVLHLAYSVYLAWYTTPLVRMHLGFAMRNELTIEWQRDDFNVVYDKNTGEAIPVNELGEEEYDENFNNFIYDPSRNKWDKGTARNLWVFWFTPRWTPGQRGEF